MNYQSFLNMFEAAPAEYRPVVFWSWNETIKPQEVISQVRQMKQAGLGGGFIHSRIGLITEYLGQDWFAAVRAAMMENKRQGLKTYLYDEDKWPSGFAGGALPLENSEFRMKTLVARSVSGEMSEDYTPVGKPHQDIQVYEWTSPLGHEWFNGTSYSDMMSKQAMNRFVSLSYSQYYDKLADIYDDTVVAEFTDEPCTCFRMKLPRGSVPYSGDFIGEFKTRHGYDPRDKFYLLFVNSEESAGFRLHYYRTINHLFEQNFTKQISRWCSSNNIAFTGHYMCEHSIYDQQVWGTDIMPNYRHQTWPGIDHLSRQIHEVLSAKQCQSVVNQYGKTRMLSELYGCAGQNLTFEDRHWIASQQIALGVNFLNPHLSLYTMAGCRKRDFPPNLFYQQPWWPANAAIDIPLARLCYAMSQGRYEPQILVLHPQESTFALWQGRTSDEKGNPLDDRLASEPEPAADGIRAEIEQLDQNLKDIILTLQNNHLSYDLASERILREDGELLLKDNPPKIQVKMMTYQALIVPPMQTISPEVLEMVNRFQMTGGLVICCGKPPKMVDGKESDTLNIGIKSDVGHLAKLLREKISPLITITAYEPEHAKDIWMHPRTIDNGDKLLFLTNLSRNKKVDAIISVQGEFDQTVLLNHWTGRGDDLKQDMNHGRTELGFSFHPVQSALILFNKAEAPLEIKSRPKYKTSSSLKVATDSIVPTRLDDNALTLDKALITINGHQSFQRPLPVVALQQMLNEQAYEGPLKLTYSFSSETDFIPNCRLVVENAPRISQIVLNGSQIRYSGDSHWLDIRWHPIDIAGLIRKGLNHIDLIYDDFRYGNIGEIKDMQGRYGTEIESIYLVGDFSLSQEKCTHPFDRTYWDRYGIPTEQCFFKAGSFVLTNPGNFVYGDMTGQGSPFYAGRLNYRISLPAMKLEENERLILKTERLNAVCCEIPIDAKTKQYLISRPFEADISNCVSRGYFDLVLYSSLRNLLGPHHHVGGELTGVSPDSFLPHFKSGTYSENLDCWDKGEIRPSDWNEDYCFIHFGDLGKMYLEIQKELV